jgi:hypothetical protein
MVVFFGLLMLNPIRFAQQFQIIYQVQIIYLDFLYLLFLTFATFFKKVGFNINLANLGSVFFPDQRAPG